MITVSPPPSTQETSVATRKRTGCWPGAVTNSYTWEKKLVMHNDQRPSVSSPVHWDAQIWKDDSVWYQLTGGAENGKGAAQIWSSPDLEKWTCQKAIYSGGPGNYWELPYLIPFGEKNALFVGKGNPYWIGEYDPTALTFTPDKDQPQSIDNGNYYSFNLHMTDDKGSNSKPRQLMHGWVTGSKSPTKTIPYWEGAHSVPRVVTFVGDRLWQEPIPELQILRAKHYTLTDLPKENLLKDIKGDALELKATFASGTLQSVSASNCVCLRMKRPSRVCTSTRPFTHLEWTVKRTRTNLRSLTLSREKMLRCTSSWMDLLSKPM